MSVQENQPPKDGTEQPPTTKKTEPSSSAGKQGDKAKKSFDPFFREELLPDLASVFTFQPKSLQDIKDTAIVVIDANTLLLPYDAGRIARADIVNTYQQLATQGRLRIPEQVVREFAVHRLGKIEKLYADVSSLASQLQNPPVVKNFTITDLEAFTDYEQARGDAKSAKKKCDDAVCKLRQEVRHWYEADPVLVAYRGFITAEMMIAPDKSHEELRKDNDYRNTHNLPPGTADAKKPDGGIGDKIIWNTILKLGEETKKDLIFVTQDITKKDWVHVHTKDKQAEVLFPRYELVEEYRKSSDDGTLHIIELSELLALFGANKESIEKVEQIEGAILEEDEQENYLYSKWLAKKVAAKLRRSPRSFEFLRSQGINFSDDEFRKLIAIHPDLFRGRRIRRHDEKGQRIPRGKPGIGLRRVN